MEAWEQWREMARESEEAARLAEVGGCFRSAASRQPVLLRGVSECDGFASLSRSDAATWAGGVEPRGYAVPHSNANVAAHGEAAEK